MRFLFYHTIADADFGNVNIFSGFYDGVNKVTTKDIFTNVQAKSLIPMEMRPNIAVKSMQSRSPIIGYKADSRSFDQSAGYTDVTVIYNFVLQQTEGKTESFSNTTLLKSIKDQLTNALKDAALAKLVFEMIMAQIIWELNDYASIKNIDTEYECSSELTNLLVTNDLLRSGSQNATLRQDDCTDKLSIELPSYYELMSDDDDRIVFGMLPVKDQLCKLYTDERMYTTSYMEACRDNKARLLEVIGDPKNNTMEIFDNEKDFYNTVIAWIKTNMQKAGTKTIDEETQQYLFTLIYQMYILNWGHCVRVPNQMLAETSSRNEDALDSDGVSRFAMKIECEPGDNACISLKEFLTDAIAAYGYEILVNLLIQICRWGERKPTCLVIGTSADDLSDRVFDLNEGFSKMQRQIKGELTEQDPDKFICIGKIYAKPDFAVGYVRKVISKDETGAPFVSLYPVFFGDYLNDFEKEGKEFVEEQEGTLLLSDAFGQNLVGYVNERSRKYVSMLGTENITLSREFNSMFALNTVLANGPEKLSAYKVDAPMDIFNLANRFMISIQVVACYNYFREYANIFAELSKISGPIDYETWKSLIEREHAELGVFENKQASNTASAIASAPQESVVTDASAVQQFSTNEPEATPTSVFSMTPKPAMPTATMETPAQQPVTTKASSCTYLKAADEYMLICNVKLKDKTVAQVGINPLTINGKTYSTYTILDPANVRAIPDDAEHTKDFFLIIGHVIHAFRAMASDPEKQRLFFESENAHKTFANTVVKLDSVL